MVSKVLAFIWDILSLQSLQLFFYREKCPITHLQKIFFELLVLNPLHTSEKNKLFG